MSEEFDQRKRIRKGIDSIVDEAKAAGEVVWSSVETLGDNMKEAVQVALSGRENVVMVRLNTESLSRLDSLVEAGLVSSRSEAGAFLIGEGIKARAGLFDRISEKVDQIRRAKEDLRDLINEPAGEPSTDGATRPDFVG